jgi:phosphatidylglycerol:prolipoprotein diacylglycerol transferase
MNHYVHHLSPFAIQFTESFGIRWYGLAYLAGFVAGYWTVSRFASRRTTPIPVDKVADFVTLVAIGVMAGGRLGYVFFYSPHLLWDFHGGFPFWGLLEVHKGGMSSHGGLLGVVLVCLWYAQRNGYNRLHIVDLCCFGGAIGFWLGRIANFINGELFGREAPAALAWAVKFPSEISYWISHDTEKLGRLGPAVEALGTVSLRQGPTQLTQDVWTQWMAQMSTDPSARSQVYSLADQVMAAAQSGNAKVLEALQWVLTPRYPSQLIQSFLEGFVVLVVLILIWIRPRKPGVVAGWFGLLYAIMRIIGEQYRMPDAQIGFQWLGLTRGQWLSFFFVGLGALFLFWAIRQKDAQVLGGWFSRDLVKPTKK